MYQESDIERSFTKETKTLNTEGTADIWRVLSILYLFQKHVILFLHWNFGISTNPYCMHIVSFFKLFQNIQILSWNFENWDI